jgi:hypothetical protein
VSVAGEKDCTCRAEKAERIWGDPRFAIEQAQLKPQSMGEVDGETGGGRNDGPRVFPLAGRINGRPINY